MKYDNFSENGDSLAKLLSRMCLVSKNHKEDKLSVRIPPTRHDVIHACDIYEDVAISYGYVFTFILYFIQILFSKITLLIDLIKTLL